MEFRRARFGVGEIVQHRLLGYRGVVFDVDPTFQLSDGWYEREAATRPPKNRPWYRVLVDGTEDVAYVAERHLEREADPRPVGHPLVARHFGIFEGGRYFRLQPFN